MLNSNKMKSKIEQEEYINDNFKLELHHTSKRRTRHTIFSRIDTELQAYILGFFAADGSIDEKRKTFRVKIKEEDSEIIYLIKDTICPDARLFNVEPYEITGRNNKKYIGKRQFGIDVNSTYIVNDLVSLGYGYNKTYSELKLPNINKNLIRHFIRGYFDSDGSFCGNIRYDEDKSPRKVVKFSICSKKLSILEDIKNFFKENGINVNIYYQKRDDMYLLNTSSQRQVKLIYKLLYHDSNYYLTRKFNKISYYVNTEVNQIIIDHRNAQEMSDSESNNSPKSAEHPYRDENVR